MNKSSIYNSLDDIKKLSVAEKIIIIEDIWDSIISSDEELALSDKQKKELDKRIEAYKKNPDEVKSWDEVKKNISSRL